MYEIAPAVEAALHAGARVDVGWVVAATGFSARDGREALAIASGGQDEAGSDQIGSVQTGSLLSGSVLSGSVLSGSANQQLADLAAGGATSRRVSLHVSEADALAAGLSCGGTAQCLLIPAADLPADLWGRLRRRESVCLVTRLGGASGDDVTGTTLHTRADIASAGAVAAELFERGASAVAVSGDTVVTVLAPVPRLVVVGAGAIADALTAIGGLLGWEAQVVTDLDAAADAVAGLAAVDQLVVLSHDLDLAGPVLAAALAGPVGYVGALGSRRTQQARADWLGARGVTDLRRVHGPAGLDIGSRTPGEIAVSIVAEAIAVANTPPIRA